MRTIPEPHKHLVRFYGLYANRVRATYPREQDTALSGTDGEANEQTAKRALSKGWSELIYRIFELDPLECPRCGAGMKILAFLLDSKVIRQFLDHLHQKAPVRELHPRTME